MNPLNSIVSFIILAQEDYGFTLGPMGPAIRERLIVIGAILLVVTGITLFIVLRQKPKGSSHHHHRPHRPQRRIVKNVETKSPSSEHEHGHGKRWRRRRREHRPRNPTLAETGGLPPVRRDDEPPAPPPREAGQTQTP